MLHTKLNLAFAGLALALAACGAQPAASTSTAPPAPSQPAATVAATAAPAPTTEPSSVPTTPPAAEPTSAPSAQPSAAAIDPAIERAVRQKLAAEGMTIAYTVVLQAAEGDYVRVQAIPADSNATDPAWLFLKRSGAEWTVVAGPGTAFGPDDFAADGIPASLAPGAAGATCDELREPLAGLLKAPVEVSAATFNHMLTSAPLDGCQLSAGGTGAQFGSFVEVSRQIGDLLTKSGWQPDQQYVADGPTGTVQGYRKGGQLAVVSAEWKPGPGASCPSDQPIGDCQLTPEQQQLTFMVNVAAVPAT